MTFKNYTKPKEFMGRYISESCANCYDAAHMEWPTVEERELKMQFRPKPMKLEEGAFPFRLPGKEYL